MVVRTFIDLEPFEGDLLLILSDAGENARVNRGTESFARFLKNFRNLSKILKTWRQSN
jgi:hypothetical protein